MISTEWLDSSHDARFDPLECLERRAHQLDLFRPSMIVFYYPEDHTCLFEIICPPNGGSRAKAYHSSKVDLRRDYLGTYVPSDSSGALRWFEGNAQVRV